MKEINLASPINSLGYGVASRGILGGLVAKGVKVNLFPLGPHDKCPVVEKCIENTVSYDPTAPSLRIYHQHDLAMHVGRGEHVGFPIFETDSFTDHELHQLWACDRLFVCSEWAKDVVKDAFYTKYKCVDAKIDVVPLGVDSNLFLPQESSRPETIFFNCGKWEVRKGHDLIIKAFEDAFSPHDNVELWMMTENPFYKNGENDWWRRLYQKSPMRHRIRFIPRVRTSTQVAQIMQQSDCGVFPARAEGWNLELLEMMACGKHVIATDYSGHTEFCNDLNCVLLKVDETERAVDSCGAHPKGYWFKGNRGNWAKLGSKHVADMSNAMLGLHRMKQAGGDITNYAGVETARKFSWSNSAKRIIQVLNE